MWTLGPSIWSGSNGNKNDGVAILIGNPHILVKGNTVIKDGRAILVNLTVLDKDFNILNVYGYTGKNERYELLEDLQPHLLGRVPLVVAGDFNCVLSQKDRKRTTEDFRVDKTSVLLQGLIKDFKLVDCFRTLHQREEGYTWFSGDGTRASRTERFDVFTRDCPPTDATLTPTFFSDHIMLSCTLSLPTGVTVGGGLWKLNCSLLEDEDVVREYREQFSQWQTLQDFYDSRAQWWEMVKERTRQYFRKRACAVPGRKITDSLILIRDAICYARDRNIRLVVLNLDFEKAFDRISHQFLFKPGWDCYTTGCPLSPLLYVVCIEPLAQILRRDKWIKGLDVPGTGGLTATCVLYMDDVTLLATDILSIRRAMDLTDWYGRASGAKLNRDKSEAQLFGPWGDVDTGGLDLVVRDNDFKILGVKFDKEGGGRGNWTDILGKPSEEIFIEPREGGVLFLVGVQVGAPEEGCSEEEARKCRFTALHIKYAVTPSKDNKTAAMDREPVSPVPGLTLREAKQVHKDLSWMVAHEILPVRAVMHSRGMAKNPVCPRPGCNSPETVYHLLWECSAARDLWAKTGPLYFPCLPAGGAQIGYQLAILGVGRGLKDLTAQEFTSVWLTLNVIKDAIWATRNLLVGKRVTVPLHACELKVTSMLQGYRATIFGRGGRGRTERMHPHHSGYGNSGPAGRRRGDLR
ncbi:hypothetical protein M9458_054526 [Cirrhinus mrigala]|uniref:Reverse transcriptase n=1 Tax=Cirrhinus mrigala TaxID=683832 RepID=A0ABD0MMD6_CIRMR